MTKRNFRRSRSLKQAKRQHQENPKMVEEEQPSEPEQQDQNARDPSSMEEDLPSQRLRDQSPEEDQDPKSAEEDGHDSKLVLVEEESAPQDLHHDEDGTHDQENQPPNEIHDSENLQKESQHSVTQALDKMHDLENQQKEATATVDLEVEKTNNENQPLLQEQDQEREEEEQQQQQQQQLEDKKPEPEPEPQPGVDGVALSPTFPPPADEITFPEIIQDNPILHAPNVNRKGLRRKKTLNYRQRAALEKKLLAVKEKLLPIPFIPSKTLDFSRHEELLKRLGLWDFAHLDFDREIRTDLLTQLIANFNPHMRYSYVNDFRIMVNGADLGRALKLPPKKDKMNQLEATDSDMEKLPESSVAFLEDFVSIWFVLHEDTWIPPNEIVASTKLIKDGHPEKVDWRRLIWFMVEKELTQSSQSGSCYYASHLQYLMKAQQACLFGEPITESYNMEEEDVFDIKETNPEDFQQQEMESLHMKLTVGQLKTESEEIKDEDDVMDFQHCKNGEHSFFPLDGKIHVGEHFLQRCNLDNVGGSESEHDLKEEEEEQLENDDEEPEKQEEGMNDFLSKPSSLERLSPTELIQAKGTTKLPCNTADHLFSHPSGELLTLGVDNHMNSVGSSLFVSGYKRELDNVNDVNHHSFNDHKRMRSTVPWEENKASDFDLCMEQVKSWMGKARMIYEAKNQEMMNSHSHLHLQALIAEVQQRNNIIEALHRSKAEEERRRGLEIYRLEQELYVMISLLNGYKKALKETRRAFYEYWECYSQPNEPLYKDVPGTCGVHLRTIELEKQQEPEEELTDKSSMFEEQIKDFEQIWFGMFELHKKKVECLDRRLLDLENRTKLCKESVAKSEVLET